jgi:hypothetical protein
MPGKVKDITGQVFNRLTVLGLSHIELKRSYWTCVCSCGRQVIVRSDQLRAGTTKSCGCFNAERITKHGMSRSPEYKAWLSMLGRCLNPTYDSYLDYGGRGITVDPSWLDFNIFISDMGRRPSKLHSINRKDNDGPYYKGNCMWSLSVDQMRNRRTTPYLTYRGHIKPLGEWSERYGISTKVLWGRVFLLNWSVEKALETPVRRRPLYT